jgi:hypothetical protein
VIRRIAPLAIVLPLVLASGASAARPCTADELRDTRTPADLGSLNIESASKDPLVAGTGYRIVVVREYAIGDNVQPVDSTIAVTAPNGPALQPASEDGRPAYDFTPTAAGTVRIVVSWDDEVGYGSGQFCSASRTFDIQVLAPTLPTFKGSFRKPNLFRFHLFGKEPQDPGDVTLILRGKRGTTRPPAPRGRALGRWVFKPEDGRFSEKRGGDHGLRRTFSADTIRAGIEIYPEVNIPFGKTLRYAFSVEVVQNGRRLGGMRAGAKCHRVQLTGHSVVRCRPVGLKQRP